MRELTGAEIEVLAARPKVCARTARWKLTYVRTLINDGQRCRQPSHDEK